MSVISTRPTVQPWTPRAKTLSFSGQTPKQDPQPGYGWRNLASLAVVLAGFIGAGKVTGMVNQFHRWAESRTYAQQPDQPNAKDQLLDQVARLDRELRKVPGVTTAESVYMLMLRWQMLLLSVSALPGVFRKNIRLDQVYGELHKRGITGKNLKIAVLDSGYAPGAEPGKNKIKFRTTDKDGDLVLPYDDVGHGTAVTNLIASACPDSEILVMPFASDTQIKDMNQLMNTRLKAYLTACLDKPERLTLKGIREIYAPFLHLLASGVRKAVAEGAHVVNLSLGTVENVDMVLQQARINALLRDVIVTTMGSQDAEVVKEKMARLHQRITEISKIHRTSESLDDTIRQHLAPWKAALDYAHKKGVAVVVAAGNDGGHHFDQPDILANINLLGALDHPALIVVGSTRQNGEISSFTTEYNDVQRPWVAANGSGELSTDIIPPSIDPWKWMVPPLWPFLPLEYIKNRMQYQNPQGTSFAAPDVAALYIMMKSANPKITPVQAKTLMKSMAEPSHFGTLEGVQIRMEVIHRLVSRQPGYKDLSAMEQRRVSYTTCMADFVGLDTGIPKEEIDRELNAEIARRTGAGTLASRRLATVEAAEKLNS